MHNYWFININSENLWYYRKFHDLQHDGSSSEEDTLNYTNTLNGAILSPQTPPYVMVFTTYIGTSSWQDQQSLSSLLASLWPQQQKNHNLLCVLVVKFISIFLTLTYIFLFSARVTGCPFWPCLQISKLILYMWLSDPQRVPCPHLPFLSWQWWVVACKQTGWASHL